MRVLCSRAIGAITGVMLFFGASPLIAESRFERAPDEPYRVGPYLEAYFQDIVRSCDVSLSDGLVREISQRLPWPKKREKISAVPAPIRDYLRAEGHPHGPIYKRIPKIEFGRLLSQIYPSTASTAAATISARSSLAGLTRLLENPDFISGFNGISYYQDCTSLAALALSAEANASPPASTLRAAVSAEIGSNNKTSSIVSAGKFLNPIMSAYNGGGALNANHQPEAAFVILDWYEQHPERRDENNWYIDSIEGVVIATLSGGERRQELVGSTDASFNLVAASFGGNGDLSISTNSKFRTERFDVLVFEDESSPTGYTYTKKNLPKFVEALTRFNSSAVARPRESSTIRLFKGGSWEERFNLPGVTKRFCTSSNWKAEIDRVDVVIVEATHFETDYGGQACELQLSFTRTNMSDGSAGMFVGNVTFSMPYMRFTRNASVEEAEPLTVRSSNLTFLVMDHNSAEQSQSVALHR